MLKAIKLCVSLKTPWSHIDSIFHEVMNVQDVRLSQHCTVNNFAIENNSGSITVDIMALHDAMPMVVVFCM